MDYPTIHLSLCCRDVAIADETEDGSTQYTCMKCEKTCETEEVCEWCYGTGEIIYDEPVYPGEPHMADIGSRTCPHLKINRDNNE